MTSSSNELGFLKVERDSSDGEQGRYIPPLSILKYIKCGRQNFFHQEEGLPGKHILGPGQGWCGTPGFTYSKKVKEIEQTGISRGHSERTWGGKSEGDVGGHTQHGVECLHSAGNSGRREAEA